MLCHHYKCIFVHIPKNAGQSIERVFLDKLNLTWEIRAPLLLRKNDNPKLGPTHLAHLKARDYVDFKYISKEIFDSYYKFSFVRNPWSRLLSFYKYRNYHERYEFNDFVLGVFQDHVFKNENWFVGPQSNYIFSDSGEQHVDFVGRFENLQDDFNFVCRKIGIPPTPVPHTNQSKGNDVLAKSNLQASPKTAKKLLKNMINNTFTAEKPRYRTYQEYYNQEAIDCVAHIYRKDIELFGYDFE